MPCPRTTAPRAPIPVPANPRRRAIRSRSCCCRPATAARSKAASSPPPDVERSMVPATARDNRPVPARAGIGLRFQHHRAVLEAAPDVAFMEVHTENYMGGGSPIHCLEAVRRDFPLSLHGVGLSLGSAEGLDPAHLDRVRRVAERIEPALMSEHIAWSVTDGTYLADL